MSEEQKDLVVWNSANDMGLVDTKGENIINVLRRSAKVQKIVIYNSSTTFLYQFKDGTKIEAEHWKNNPTKEYSYRIIK